LLVSFDAVYWQKMANYPRCLTGISCSRCHPHCRTHRIAKQKAKLVSDSAQQVTKVSQTGRQAVDELIAGMNRIREIILTVNDLAEQSNLLAVNAAIEPSWAISRRRPGRR